MIVISIIGIITAITIPRWTQYRDLAEEGVCVTNRMTVQRLQEICLFENSYDNIEDEDEVCSILNQFIIIKNIDKVCQSNVVDISYNGGKVKCSLHEYGI